MKPPPYLARQSYHILFHFATKIFTVTGGKTDFTGKRLVVAAGDFHPLEYRPGHKYRIDVYNEKGLVFSQGFTGKKMAYFAIDTEPCKYYRTDVYDVTVDYIFAIGTPIWNEP